MRISIPLPRLSQHRQLRTTGDDPANTRILLTQNSSDPLIPRYQISAAANTLQHGDKSPGEITPINTTPIPGASRSPQRQFRQRPLPRLIPLYRRYYLIPTTHFLFFLYHSPKDSFSTPGIS